MQPPPHRRRPLVFVAHLALILGCAAGAHAATGYTVVAWNNLGMHCMDGDYAVLSLLPPYNTIHAQVMDPAGVLVTDPAAAGLTATYEAVADPDGSINTTSQGKTNFWDHLLGLFGVSLAVDHGLAGKSMPGAGNVPQPMTWVAASQWFIAEGIPITPTDDQGRKNPYPMMRVVVRDAGGAALASTDIVLPVSDEMDCRACHASGSGPAAQPAAGWVNDADPQRDMRFNILRLHDQLQAGNGTFQSALAAAGYDPAGLEATVRNEGRSILCATCHLSEALPGSGIAGIPPLTSSMHSMHGTVIDPTTNQTLDASANRTACYRCHPGSATKCLRGAMGAAVAADGSMEMQCQACHGQMHDVGSAARTGWLDEPGCGSCHTGTAVKNAGLIRFTSVYDAPGHRRDPVDRTFATNTDTPAPGFSLYRFSAGHGGLACEACHGSTHAEFPSSHRNDNIQSLERQGHVGMLVECTACHAATPNTINGGPHGMHPVGQAWVSGHGNALEGGGGVQQCQACHGSDYRGTVLSRVQADRTLSAFGTKTMWRGFQVGCYTCHRGPGGEDANPNRPAVVQNASATTAKNAPVQIAIAAQDPDHDALTLRVVSQPAHGTAGLQGTTATYFPDPEFTGTDVFTVAAWDGSTDSNLATVTVGVDTGGPGVHGPDLVVSWVKSQMRCRNTAAGLRCSFSGQVTVTNQGDAPVGLSILRGYLSDTPLLGGGAVALKDVKVNKLPAGRTVKRGLKGKLPLGVDGTTKFVIAVADATNLVVESNESNNQAVTGPFPAPGSTGDGTGGN